MKSLAQRLRGRGRGNLLNSTSLMWSSGPGIPFMGMCVADSPARPPALPDRCACQPFLPALLALPACSACPLSGLPARPALLCLLARVLLPSSLPSLQHKSCRSRCCCRNVFKGNAVCSVCSYWDEESKFLIIDVTFN